MPSAHELYNEADALKDEGKLEEALAKLQQIAEFDPSFALAHSAMAVICGRMGQHDEAIRHGQRVCELEPNDPFSFTAMSVTFQRAFAGTGNHAFIQMAEDAMAQAHMLEQK